MIQTATARSARARMAAAIRAHGNDSPVAIRARRAHRTAHVAAQILAAHKELGGFTAGERDVLSAAIYGDEVSVRA